MMEQDLRLACFFIGYPRSGHSLTGALLDAHPQVCLSHELDAFKLLRSEQPSREALFEQIIANARAYAAAGAQNQGYNYRIEGLWQGDWTQLRVIGDKCGSHTTMELLAQPELLKQAEEVLQLPLKFVHVIRNPYDVVTTSIRRSLERNPRLKLARLRRRKIDKFFRHAEFIQQLRSSGQIDYIDVYHERFVAEPQAELARICAFLGLEADADYLEKATRIVFPTSQQSRQKVDWWTRWRRWRFQRRMAAIPFFAYYTFEN